jgi:hypothetical protein
VRREGGSNERLCRNAACIHACSAKSASLDDGDALPGAGHPDCERGSRLAGSDDNGIVNFLHLPLPESYFEIASTISTVATIAPA